MRCDGNSMKHGGESNIKFRPGPGRRKARGDFHLSEKSGAGSFNMRADIAVKADLRVSRSIGRNSSGEGTRKLEDHRVERDEPSCYKTCLMEYWVF